MLLGHLTQRATSSSSAQVPDLALRSPFHWRSSSLPSLGFSVPQPASQATSRPLHCSHPALSTSPTFLMFVLSPLVIVSGDRLSNILLMSCPNAYLQARSFLGFQIHVSNCPCCHVHLMSSKYLSNNVTETPLLIYPSSSMAPCGRFPMGIHGKIHPAYLKVTSFLRLFRPKKLRAILDLFL